MSKVVRDALIGGVFGGVLGAGAIFTGLSYATQSDSDRRAEIEACAEYLTDTQQSLSGQEAPEDCASFDLGSYYLPPRQEFIETETANLTTDEEQREINIKVSIGVGAVGLFIGAFVGGVTRKRMEEVEKIRDSSPGSLVI